MQKTTNKLQTLSDLQSEITLVKNRLREREKDFEQSRKRLPEESFKALLGLVIPATINNKIANNAFHFLKDAATLLFGSKQKNADWKTVLTGAGKQVLIITGLKLITGLLTKNRKAGS
jgi:hypothetical protein